MSILIANSADAAHYLKQNQNNLQKGLKRVLSSGKRITGGGDDPGGLAVSMKINASIKRLAGADNNVQNAMSYMEVQDGLLETAGNIITRISELKGLHSDDPLKSTANLAAYNTELADLVAQLDDMKTATFNGEDLFETAQTINYDEDTAADLTLAASGFATAVGGLDGAGDFAALDVATIDTALDNVAGLRAQNGSGQNRLQFTAQSLSLQRIQYGSCLEPNRGCGPSCRNRRTGEALYFNSGVASMVAQANSQNDIALMLLS